jgi:hypothetical protein
LFITGELLADLGFEAYSAGSGAAAIAALKSAGSFDLGD